MSITQQNIDINENAEINEILFRESFVFTLGLVAFTDKLELKKKTALAKKLFDAGMDLGKNVNEARLSKKNKTHLSNLKKMTKIAVDIKYLLQLAKYSVGYPNPDTLITDLDELIEKIRGIMKINY